MLVRWKRLLFNGMDKKPAAQLGFKPGGFGRHDFSGVRYAEKVGHGDGHYYINLFFKIFRLSI